MARSQVFPANIATTPLANDGGKTVTKRVPTVPLSAVVMSKTIPAGAPGADLTAASTAFGVVPAGHRFHVLSIELISFGAVAGVDADNTLAVTIHDLTANQNVVTKVFDDDEVVYPNPGQANSFAVPAGAILPSGAVLGVAVTQGATADHNGFVIQVSGVIEPNPVDTLACN